MNQKELLALQWKEINSPYWENVGLGYMKSSVATIPDRDMAGVGIDPGRNFGISWVDGPTLGILWGQMPKEEHLWRYGITAFHMIQDVTRGIEGFPAVVEGPSFRAKYGQPALESIRFGFALGLIEKGLAVEVVPPATIRAQVLGHGHNRATDFWPTLNENAADAAAAALYAAGVRRKGEAKRWPPKKGT